MPVSADVASSQNYQVASGDPLLQPFSIGRLTIKNRLMSAAHGLRIIRDGVPGIAHDLYHEERAKGGIGLIVCGGSSNVSIDSSDIFGQMYLGNPDVVPALVRFSESIHRHGTALFCQITHLGRRGEAAADRMLPSIGPSMIRERLHRSFPKAMDEFDIARVVRDFGEAALRCRDGGIDGVEVMTSGHLLGQFLSPRTNLRTDGFGGSLANRCRLTILVHEEIRRRTGDDFILGSRFIIDEGQDGDMTLEECIEAAHILETAGLVDFFNANYGRIDTEANIADEHMPGMELRLGPYLDHVAAFRKEVSTPVFHSGRMDVATARYAVREGILDIAGLTRGHIADPHILSKIAAGEEERVRPCVGATFCHIGDGRCIHNAASGRESALPHVASRAGEVRRVVVVGGGPAGLEAARVAAERGHRVVLFEAAQRLGGQVAIAARTPWRRDLIGIIDWRAAEIERMGVKIRLNVFATAEDILAEEPDLIILATGGVPDSEWLPGADLCNNVWEIVTSETPLRNRVLIYDGTGRQPALHAAEAAQNNGSEIRFVASDSSLGNELMRGERIMWKRRLGRALENAIFDLELIRVLRAEDGLAAHFRSLVTAKESVLLADQVIVEQGTRPADDLYHKLRGHAVNNGVTDIVRLLAGERQVADGGRAGKAFELHRIGDAVASRNIHAAVLDALRLAHAA